MKISKKDLKNSEVEFTVTVPSDVFETYHKRAFAEVQKSIEVEGFRKGNAPEDVVVKKYGEMIILEEMANLALRDAYIRALEDHKIMPIAEPKVAITKIAKGNPLELTITVPVMPEIKLPAYKKIAKDITKNKEVVEVTDKDIEDVIEELRKGRAHAHAHDHKHEDIQLPELTDEFAQSFGEDFKTVEDLKKKVGDNLKLEKEQKAKEKRRAEVMEALIKEVEVELPHVMVDGELQNMLVQMKGDITRFGGTWEEYLTHSKKTEEDIKKDWRKDAEKRAISQILLHKIAEAEKLTATEQEIEVELIRLLATVQDANEERAKVYLYQALTNEKVLAFLESVA
jgi:FKBP-type peptidyl-prolyl cis-trans isomerase (trigger factor)